MTGTRLVLLVTAALLVAACTTPASRTPVAPAAAASAPAPGDEAARAPVVAEQAAKADPVVCKTVIPTGTRVAQRSCRRRSDEEKMQRDAREALEMVQNRGVQTGNTTRDQ